jgi:hypothetical protein
VNILMRPRVAVFSSASVVPTSQSRDTSSICAILMAASIEGFISSRSYLSYPGSYSAGVYMKVLPATSGYEPDLAAIK